MPPEAIPSGVHATTGAAVSKLTTSASTLTMLVPVNAPRMVIVWELPPKIRWIT